MLYTARPYQEIVTNRIIEQDKFMAVLDMGLGKTVSTLTALNQLLTDYFSISRVLIIAPKRVALFTWPEEISKWDHLKNLDYSILVGDAKKREEALNSDSQISIINVDNLVWLYNYHKTNKLKWPFDAVVVDESSLFKNHASKRFKCLAKITSYTKRVILLTGTPTPNGLHDLWSQIYLLDHGQRLGKNITTYRTRYFDYNPYRYEYILKSGADKEIYSLIDDVSFSMKSIDYIRLPKKIDNFLTLQLANETRDQYNKLERDFLLNIEDTDITALNAATLSSKLLQLANGAIYDDEGSYQELHNTKLEALQEILETSNKPILVFYWYKHDYERLVKFFKIYKPRTLNTPKDKEDWDSGNIRLLFAHPASMGHGLNLQSGGSTIVWFGLTWSLELYQQANARLYRQGQTETVVIHHLIAKDTIDELVVKKLQQKEITQNDLIEAIKYRRDKYVHDIR